MIIKKNCLICNKKIEIPMFRLKFGQGKFCSYSCRNKFYSKEKSGNWKGGKVQKFCKVCGEEFSINKSTLKYGWGLLCSLRCSRKYHTRVFQKKGQVECSNCKKIFFLKPIRLKSSKNHFCSWKCYQNWKFKNPKAKQSIIYGREFNNKFKDEIRYRDKYCQNCYSQEYNKKLAIHHIDYDKFNNKSGNLISLCNSCHSKTNRDRDKWQFLFSIHKRWDELILEEKYL